MTLSTVYTLPTVFIVERVRKPTYEQFNVVEDGSALIERRCIESFINDGDVHWKFVAIITV